MKILIQEALEEGAFGLSSGLIYPPGMYSTTHELTELAKVAASRGKIFTSHIRGSSETLLPAVKELIQIGEKTGVALQHSHHEAVGRDHWWKIEETLKMEEAARARGVSITYDVFPYVAANTNMTAIFPPWSLEGGIPKLLERLRNPETRDRIEADIAETIPGWPPWIPGCWAHNIVEAVGWDNIRVYHVGSEKNAKWVGRSIGEISSSLGKKPFAVVSDLMLEEGGIASCYVFGVSGDLSTDEPNKILVKHPLGAISTDAFDFGKGKPHPAAYGTYPRVIRYARDEKLLSLHEAIRKMTSWPAQIMGIRDRGMIREGLFADIVLFGLSRIADPATFDDPRHFPEGIEFVLINGKVVVEQGKYQKSLAGKVLRR
jgi:N-acyl-D-amino-acid deacylase